MIALLVVGLYLSGQQKVALVSNGITSIFSGDNPFVEAYDAAESGDTIYLPGAVLAAPPAIEKQLAIYGAGHYPDSTMATSQTIISNNIIFYDGADGSFVEGLLCNVNIDFYNNNKVDQVTLSRCRILNHVNFNGDGSDPCEFITIKHCVIDGSVNFINATSCLFSNNILAGKINNGENNAVYNNLFLYNSYWYYPLNNLDNSDIANNIFIKNNSYLHYGCDLSTFSNNVFGADPTAGTNTFLNNYPNVNVPELFVNQSGATFDYAHDYHLLDPSAYLGTEGSQVGIYGGLYPYKDGAVPSNPHIVSKNIPTMTDESGMLEVSITVNAQQE